MTQIKKLFGINLEEYATRHQCGTLERGFWNSNSVTYPREVVNMMLNIVFKNNNSKRHANILRLQKENEHRINKVASFIPVTATYEGAPSYISESHKGLDAKYNGLRYGF